MVATLTLTLKTLQVKTPPLLTCGAGITGETVFCVTNAVLVFVQPFCAVTVTVYWPATPTLGLCTLEL